MKEMEKYSEKILDELFNKLKEKKNQRIIADLENEAIEKASSNVRIEKYREYPCNDQYYIDYVDTELNEEESTKANFFSYVAYGIRNLTELPDELLNVVEDIPDEELCKDYADVFFNEEKICDFALEFKAI